jgi:hypothetical protein
MQFEPIRYNYTLKPRLSGLHLRSCRVSASRDNKKQNVARIALLLGPSLPAGRREAPATSNFSPCRILRAVVSYDTSATHGVGLRQRQRSMTH